LVTAGSGSAVISGRAVQFFWVSLSNGLRVRIAIDEWVPLGIQDGERLNLALPGELGREDIVWKSVWVETWYWLELVVAPPLSADPLETLRRPTLTRPIRAG
jgi:hypothetical protein